VAEGAVLQRVTAGHTLRVALLFGGFQALLPVVGALAGDALSGLIRAYDHWVAFALLVLIGGKMLLDAALGFETGRSRNPSGSGRLLALAVATSIDALMVGVTLGLLGTGILRPALLVGLVTGVLCAVGIQAGECVGRRLGRWAELCGGVALCLIGARILWTHTH
jgi:putative Mn2+ efflux pump MntP